MRCRLQIAILLPMGVSRQTIRFQLIALTVLVVSNASFQDGPFCHIDGTDINCDSQFSPTFNLEAELTALSGDCTSSPAVCHFANLFIHRSALRTVTNTSLGSLTFASVHVYSADNLESISVECTTEKGLQLSKQLFVNGPSKLNISSVESLLRDCTQLFQVEVALERDMHYRISPCSGTERELGELKYLIYRTNNYEIEQIDDYAFECFDNLHVIKLSQIPIRHISQNAFSRGASPGNNGTLVINLDGCLLTDSVWKTVHLHDLGRPLTLMLDNNQLSHLPFMEFLEQTDSAVSLYGNQLDCSNLKPHLWLLRQKDKYRQKVWGARCSTGEGLFDLSLYEGKCTYATNESTLRCEHILDTNFTIFQEVIYLQQIMDIQLDRLQALIVDSCSVFQITENALNAVQVATVQLANLPQLKRIDSRAFVSHSVESLDISGANQLEVASIVGLLTNQANLKRLYFSLAIGKDHILFKNAFPAGVGLSLQRIQFSPSNYRVLSIGSQFFGQLSALEELSFSGISIAEMQNRAFAFTEASNKALFLNLSSCNLDETKLLYSPFAGVNRPLKVDLSQNTIRVLTEDSFDFLLANDQHFLDLRENGIICQFGNFSSPNLHPYYWLYQNRHQLEYQIVNARCEDSSDLFEFLERQFEDSSNGSQLIMAPRAMLLISFILFSCTFRPY